MPSDATTLLNKEGTKEYKKFSSQVAQGLFCTLKHKVHNIPDKNSDEYHKAVATLQTWESKINDPSVDLNQALCNSMVEDISGLIADKSEADKYRNTATSALEAAYTATKDDALKEEDAIKYRMLQLFAVMTPLGAFSIAGQVFNYLDPIIGIFGGIFGNEGVAAGIAGASTADELWVFGDLAEMMKVDEGIEIALTKTPIVSDVLEVLSAMTTNDLVQGVGGELSPSLTNSVVPILAIAGALAVFTADKNIDRHNEKEKAEDKRVDALKILEDAARETISSKSKKSETAVTPAPSPKGRDNGKTQDLEHNQLIRESQQYAANHGAVH